MEPDRISAIQAALLANLAAAGLAGAGGVWTSRTKPELLWSGDPRRALSSGVLTPDLVGGPAHKGILLKYRTPAMKRHFEVLSRRMSPGTSLEILKGIHAARSPIPGYDPVRDIAIMHSKGPFATPISLAHELGHAESAKAGGLMKLLQGRRASGATAISAALGIGGALFGSDPDSSGLVAATTALAAAPGIRRLLLEADANIRSYKQLKDPDVARALGLSRTPISRVRKALFRPMMASYLPIFSALAATPWLISKVRAAHEGPAPMKEASAKASPEKVQGMNFAQAAVLQKRASLVRSIFPSPDFNSWVYRRTYGHLLEKVGASMKVGARFPPMPGLGSLRTSTRSAFKAPGSTFKAPALPKFTGGTKLTGVTRQTQRNTENIFGVLTPPSTITPPPGFSINAGGISTRRIVGGTPST